LFLDGAISGATGLLWLAAAGPLQELLGVPAALLRWAGLCLIPFAALVLSLARRDSPSRAGVRAVIAANAAWVAASVLVLASGRIAPNGLGYAFVLGQAFAVALLAEAQYVGLRRSGATPA
jgi:hypothetical protein